jgi:hypothetical protein
MNFGGDFHIYFEVNILYIFTLRNLSAFPTTDTELKLIAAAAKTGLKRIPRKG